MKIRTTLLAAVTFTAMGISGSVLSDDAKSQAGETMLSTQTVEIGATELVRENGAILVNREGRRFVRETGADKSAANAIANQTSQSAFLIFDDSVRRTSKDIEKYIELGLVSSEQTLESLGESLGIDGHALGHTVALYNRNVAKGVDLEFGRLDERRQDMSVTLKGKHFYAIEVTPGMEEMLQSASLKTKAKGV